jgi:hypothetical protein
MIVARHEVPGVEFGHFREQKPTARPEELGLLGVERGSPGPKGPAPKGLKNLAQRLWGFNPELSTQIGERADVWKASLLVRMDTGWKPILLYAVAGRDGSVEMLPA